ALAISLMRGVRAYQKCVSAFTKNRRERALCIRLVDVEHGHAAALLRKELADRAADTDREVVGSRPPAADHQRDLTGESAALMCWRIVCRDCCLGHGDLPPPATWASVAWDLLMRKFRLASRREWR